MTEQYEKSIQKLELPRVLALLAEHAGSESGKEQCLRLMPVSDPEDVRLLQSRTTGACAMITLKGSPGFSGVRDVSASLDRADRGGCLSAAELLRIAAVLRCAGQVKAYAEGDGCAPVLDVYFRRLTANKYLEERIRISVLSEEEIADSASPELADIRRHIRLQSAKIREVLQHIIASPAYAKILREPIITIRSDRFVVPVKSECKNDFPGLIHDVSSSGGTLFIEPTQAVNANNELRELFSREQQEIERILAELSAEAAAHRETITENYHVLTELDLIFARAKLSFRMNAGEPEIRTDGKLLLKNARHPLIDPKKVVPITARLGDDFDTLVITGPNTGGKTVTLKTLGLLTLMAECGLHIPADSGSCISVYNAVYADIGDEQSIAQNLSTFSAHMKNIVEIIGICDEKSLVLFDELGAGTDPAEGAALAVALIENCREKGARVAATTHYAEMKIYAMRTPGVSNASCEFDVETLQPTYRLLIGIPGRSNAFAISRRLGLPEPILEKARGMVDRNDVDFEEVLSQLEQQRRQMELAREEAERLRQETEKQKKQSDAYYERIREEKEKAAAIARREARQILEDARAEADQVYAELKKLRKAASDPSAVSESNRRQSELRRRLNEAEEKLLPEIKPVERSVTGGKPKAGDTVELLKFGTKATVLSVNKNGTYTLQAGAMKLDAKETEICLIQTPAPAAKHPAPRGDRPLTVAAAPELDLRGMAVDEALSVLDLYLDHAMRGNLPSVRIIHGKGTGALRTAVQEHLKRCKYVKKYRLGVYGEGENGVTIAELS